MYHMFKSFSLQHLCHSLDLDVGKLDNTRLRFCEHWYTSSFANSLEMTNYNMRDCEATLALCERLDIVNQIVALCYGAKAWIRDVALYNTGAMSLSSMCSVAWSKGYRYNWTRCDWIPDVFTGGQVLYTGEKVRRNVAIVDFVSMYPTIIRDGGISPECIDFIDYDSKTTPRFDYICSVYAYLYDSSEHTLSIGCVALGVTKGLSVDAEGMVARLARLTCGAHRIGKSGAYSCFSSSTKKLFRLAASEWNRVQGVGVWHCRLNFQIPPKLRSWKTLLASGPEFRRHII